MVQPLTDGSDRVFDPDKSVKMSEKRLTKDETHDQIRDEDRGRDAGERLLFDWFGIAQDGKPLEHVYASPNA